MHKLFISMYLLEGFSINAKTLHLHVFTGGILPLMHKITISVFTDNILQLMQTTDLIFQEHKSNKDKNTQLTAKIAHSVHQHSKFQQCCSNTCTL